MPVLNTPMNRERISHELQDSKNRTSIMRALKLSERYFRKPRGQALQTDVCFNQRDGSTIYVLVDDDLEYIGNDPEVKNAFAKNSLGGWRQVFIPNGGEIEEVLALTENLLGLSGYPPSLRLEEPLPRIVEEGKRRDTRRNEGWDKFGLDLVELARQNKLPRLIGRETELEAVMRILSKKSKNAVVLLGEAGVGKTAIVEGLAQLVAKSEVPHTLSDIRILQINMSLLPAGASLFGEFEGRMKSILEMAREDSKIVLFLDELHTICSHHSDASEMLKSDLARGNIKVIGATTFKDYRQIEQDTALARRFQKIIVREPSPEETLDILKRIKDEYEDHHNVIIPNDVLEEIIWLSIRYVKDRFLPDKAIDLMDESAAKLQLLSIKDMICVGHSSERSIDDQIKDAIISGDYTEARRLYSLKGGPRA